MASLVTSKSQQHRRIRPALLSVLGLAVACLLSSRPPAIAENGQALPAKPSVLSPDRFSYPMKLGYAAAHQFPDAVSKVFCYCGCDEFDKHTSLLDCYVSTHGAYCAICMEEAIEVKQMKEKGSTIGAIQAQIDEHFAHHYPFKKPTETLLKYRDSLRKTGIKLTELPANRTENSPRSRQPGPNCCAHDHSR